LSVINEVNLEMRNCGKDRNATRIGISPGLPTMLVIGYGVLLELGSVLGFFLRVLAAGLQVGQCMLLD
jgi:hypothetical protein